MKPASQTADWMETSDPTVLVKEPVASVLMITYNHAPYIAQAIEGVVKQKTEFPFELIIGEDCSTDDTRKIVLQYQKQYPAIIRVITSDRNVGGAQNSFRVEHSARGKYAAYCEGDDCWHNPEKLKKQVEFLEASPDYSMVHSQCHQFRVKDQKLIQNVIPVRPSLKDDNAFLDILSGARFVLTVTVCVRGDLLRKVLAENPECYDSTYPMGDIQRWLELSRLGKVGFLKESLATRNQLPESAAHSEDASKQLRFWLECRRLSLHYAKKYPCPEDFVLRMRRNTALGFLRMAYAMLDKKTAAEFYSEYKSLKGRQQIFARLLHFGCQSPLAHALVWPVMRFDIFKGQARTQIRKWLFARN